MTCRNTTYALQNKQLKWRAGSGKVVANIHGAEMKFPIGLVRINKCSHLPKDRMCPSPCVRYRVKKSRPGAFSTISLREKQIFGSIHSRTGLIITHEQQLVERLKIIQYIFQYRRYPIWSMIYFILSYFDMLQN